MLCTTLAGTITGGSNPPSGPPVETQDWDLSAGALPAEWTHTRASSGTYWDASGVLQTHQANICLQSEDFSTSWTVDLASISTNTVANPLDSAVTADTLVEDGTAASTHRVRQALSPGADGVSPYTASVYVKKANRTWVHLNLHTTAFPTGADASFDVENGVKGQESPGLDSAAIEDVGDGWYRCSITATSDVATTIYFEVYIAEADDDISFDGLSQDSLYVFGGMVNAGVTPSEYAKTTTIINSAPRFEHDPADSNAALGILIEEGRTILCLQSEDIGTTWNTTNATVDINAATAPDGNASADRVNVDASAGVHDAWQGTISVNTAVDHCCSAFVESDGAGFAFISLQGGDTTYYVTAVANLTTGSITGTTSNGSGVTYTSSGVIDCGSNIYRIWISGDINHFNAYIAVGGSDSGAPTYDAGGRPTYTPSAGEDLIVWGCQLEEGSFPTSYISTTISSVGRSPDSVSAASFGWNDSAGTIIAKGRPRYVDTGSSAEFYVLSFYEDSNSYWRMTCSGVTSRTGEYGATIRDTATQNINGADHYLASDQDFVVSLSGDGTTKMRASEDTILTDVTPAYSTLPTPTDFWIGHFSDTLHINGTIKHIKYWDSYLSDADLTTEVTALV